MTDKIIYFKRTQFPFFIYFSVFQCDGSASELGYTGNVCPYCEGTGEETVRTGHMTARKTCSYCNGSRIFIKFKCTECEGLGKKTYEAPVKLNIPAGDPHKNELKFI